MSRATPKINQRRTVATAVTTAVLLSGAVVAGAAMAGENRPAAAGGSGTASTIVCPGVADRLPAVPASAQAEVNRNLALLQAQINEADNRLATSVGQGGPDFVQNAILGPLQGKRISTIDRIAIAIGRTAARPQGLDALAPCSLNAAGAGASAPAASASASAAASAAPAAAGTVSCPDIASALPAVPAAAAAEVDKELTLLQKQIGEADNRLAASVGQGGPDFVQNAILGPLQGKRAAVVDRIALDFTRVGGQRPAGLGALTACTVAS